MALTNTKKRKVDDNYVRKPKKKIRVKQQHYSSPSASENDEFPAVDLADSDPDPDSDGTSSPPTEPALKSSLKKHKSVDRIEPRSASSSAASSASSDSDLDSNLSQPDNPNDTRLSKSHPSKRNDPAKFATSISAILGSKLSTSKRADPVLSRSTTAALANKELADSRLEIKARQKLREDKKSALEKGRVKDVLLGSDAPDMSLAAGEGTHKALAVVGERVEMERRLRKTAQRGVVKLFNAVRGAQVRGEEAGRKGGARGVREERVGEMSRGGFLEMVAGGGKGGVEEA